MSEPIDIHDPIVEICARLGVDPKYVHTLVCEPTKVSIAVYVPNERGWKQINPETGLPVIRMIETDVIT